MSAALLGALFAVSGTATLSFSLTPTSAAPLSVERVEIRGNRVLSEDVYRALVALPDTSTITARVGGRIAHRVEQFLLLAGYSLAKVRASTEDGRLVLQIEEGHLERVVFPGGSGLGALRLQLMLDLPELVFNRLALERQLDSFRRDTGIRIDHYRLNPVRGSSVGMSQIHNLGSFQGAALAPLIGRYELQIFVEELDTPPGFGLELNGTPADGLVGAIRYRFADLILFGDRLEIGVVGGLRIGKIFANQEQLRWASRLGGHVSWYSPELFGVPIRVVIGNEVVWWSRARLDLGLAQYDFFSLRPTLAVRYRPGRFLTFSAGGGALWERLLSFEALDPAATFSSPAPLQPLAFAQAQMAFGDETARLDQLHQIDVSATQVFGSAARSVLSARYRKTVGFGWDDLVLHAGIVGVPGSPPFYALERAGDEVKGLSADKLYSRLIVSAGAEYRLSLVRELYKVGVFYDGAGFKREQSASGSQAGYAQAFGFGAHALILSTFRLSAYLAFGFSDSATFEQSISMTMIQVF